MAPNDKVIKHNEDYVIGLYWCACRVILLFALWLMETGVNERMPVVCLCVSMCTPFYNSHEYVMAVLSKQQLHVGNFHLKRSVKGV